MSKSALVILAEGGEEMEIVMIVDMLRVVGVDVTLAGLNGASPVGCMRKVILTPDKSLADALAEQPLYDAIIIPGGKNGVERLSNSSVVGQVLRDHEKAGKLIGSICTGTPVLADHGVAKGKRVTSYPHDYAKEKLSKGYTYMEERVVVDGNVITSRSPGTVYWFALALIEYLLGKEKADGLEKLMVLVGY